MPCKSDNDAFLSEKGSFLVRNAGTAREAFFIQVCFHLLCSLGEHCWKEVKSLSLHLYPGEHNDAADDVPQLSWAQQLSYLYKMSPFITVTRVRLVMDSVHMQNSLVLASWKIVSSRKCRCGIGHEMCLER